MMLVSDNGASGEGGPNGSVNENKLFNGIPDDIEANLAMLDDLGSPKTYNHYPNGWAMAFNTPFKMWKRYEFNGGTSDPCIISWPKGIKAQGQIRDQYHHAIDLVPTILDALGVAAPETIKGHTQSSFDGVSMRYSFDNAKAPTTRPTQFYSMLGSRGIWHEGWKAITTHPTLSGWSHFNDDEWELYHTEVDRSETHNLAAQQPGEAARVDQWLVRGGGRQRRVPARRPLGARDFQHATTPTVRSRRTATATIPTRPRYLSAGGQYSQPLLHHRRSGRYPCAGRAGSALRPRVALRRPCALRQGQPAALRQQLCWHRGAEDRRRCGSADGREPDSLGVVRQGRRGQAPGTATGMLSLYIGDKKVGEGRIKTQPGDYGRVQG